MENTNTANTDYFTHIMIFCFIVAILGMAFVIVSIIIRTSANNTPGVIISNNSINEIVYNALNETRSLSIMSTSIKNPTCYINSVKDTDGNIVDPTKYEINNCNITYNP